jgi:hypothetical protein
VALRDLILSRALQAPLSVFWAGGFSGRLFPVTVAWVGFGTVLISFISFCNAAIFSSKVTTLVVYSLIVSLSCRICWRKLSFNWIIAACCEATISDFIRSSIGFMASMTAFTVASSDAILSAELSGIESGSKRLLFF